MSNLRKHAGYSIAAASLAGATLIALDRYAEFAAGAESFASWAIPPVFLFALALAAFVTVKLGHPDEGDTRA
ncbi:MAG: hypothetical protein AAFR32_00935 [Pseudomonadota bacterium]